MATTKKRICIIYTGGTIGMVPSQNGYVPNSARFREMLNSIQDLHHSDMADWELLEFPELFDSTDITVTEWNKMGQAIAERYHDFDGFVILHGTDTMAYSASALSFMLENLNKPVIFTGAQIPLCEIRSDGRDNLVNSLIIAASDKVHEVCLYFHGKLFRGNRSTKMSSDQFDAFESPNLIPLAEAGIGIKYQDSLLMPPTTRPFRFQPFREIPIGVLKVFPGIQFDLFESIMTEKLKGIVLEAFGAGNIPKYDHALLPIIKKAYQSGTILCVCTQCMQGTVTLGAYAASKSLQDIGAVSGVDMTTEAAVAKLYYLFSCNLSKEEIKLKMSQNICGELTA